MTVRNRTAATGCGGTCHGCATPIEQPRGGRRRKWCSDRCRKQTLYGGTCVDCGATTDGSNGRAQAPQRCSSCQHAKESAEATWTRERLLAEGQRWRVLTGRWPLTGDWNRYQNRGERRARIDELHRLTGPWPHVYIVQRIFGSWRDFVAALGGEAQPAHSGAPGQSKRARTDELRALVEELRGR